MLYSNASNVLDDVEGILSGWQIHCAYPRCRWRISQSQRGADGDPGERQQRRYAHEFSRQTVAAAAPGIVG